MTTRNPNPRAKQTTTLSVCRRNGSLSVSAVVGEAKVLWVAKNSLSTALDILRQGGEGHTRHLLSVHEKKTTSTDIDNLSAFVEDENRKDKNGKYNAWYMGRLDDENQIFVQHKDRDAAAKVFVPAQITKDKRCNYKAQRILRRQEGHSR
jgi:hypothetical protein